MEDQIHEVLNDTPGISREVVTFLGDRIEKRDASTPDGGSATVERYNGWGQIVGYHAAASIMASQTTAAAAGAAFFSGSF